MHKENMLQKIDHTKLKYFKDLDPQFLNKPFDPNNNYSIPYTWGATGILDHGLILLLSTQRPIQDGRISYLQQRT